MKKYTTCDINYKRESTADMSVKDQILYSPLFVDKNFLFTEKTGFVYKLYKNSMLKKFINYRNINQNCIFHSKHEFCVTFDQDENNEVTPVFRNWDKLCISAKDRANIYLKEHNTEIYNNIVQKLLYGLENVRDNIYKYNGTSDELCATVIRLHLDFHIYNSNEHSINITTELSMINNTYVNKYMENIKQRTLTAVTDSKSYGHEDFLSDPLGYYRPR